NGECRWPPTSSCRAAPRSPRSARRLATTRRPRSAAPSRRRRDSLQGRGVRLGEVPRERLCLIELEQRSEPSRQLPIALEHHLAAPPYVHQLCITHQYVHQCPEVAGRCERHRMPGILEADVHIFFIAVLHDDPPVAAQPGCTL